MDRVELTKKLAQNEELTGEEMLAVQDYLAELSNKLGLDPKAIYNHMWKGIFKADRRPRHPVRVGSKVGRNDICPCGKLIKYKKCCGINN